jgi:hypothetical protein
MTDEPAIPPPQQTSPLEYAATVAGADADVRRIEVRESADGLVVTFPPRRVWTLILAPALLAVFLTGALAFVLMQIWQPWRRRGVDACAVFVVFALAALALAALVALIRSARTGSLPVLMHVSPTGLLLDDPSAPTRRGRARRWGAAEIGYVYVQRGGLTATLGFDITISIIRPGVGSMEHVLTAHTRRRETHRELELMINRHLRSVGGVGASGASAPVIPMRATLD